MTATNARLTCAMDFSDRTENRNADFARDRNRKLSNSK
jgi:hypothetical protein